jgi:hypothetical protein
MARGARAISQSVASRNAHWVRDRAGSGRHGNPPDLEPLGLTMLLSFAAPEYAFSLATAVTFLLGAAAMQLLVLAVIGALVNAPVPHVCAFIAYAFISTYLIYGVPSLGRLWVWVQIPTATAFYMVLFDHHGLGWDNAQMFAGLAVAVTILWLFNDVIWPEPAAAVLSGSLRSTLDWSRRRLELLIRIFLAEGGAIPNHDRRRVPARLPSDVAGGLHSQRRQCSRTRGAIGGRDRRRANSQ